MVKGRKDHHGGWRQRVRTSRVRAGEQRQVKVRWTSSHMSVCVLACLPSCVCVCCAPGGLSDWLLSRMSSTSYRPQSLPTPSITYLLYHLPSITICSSQADLSRFEAALQATIRVPSTVTASSPLELQSPRPDSTVNTTLDDDDIWPVSW